LVLPWFAIPRKKNSRKRKGKRKQGSKVDDRKDKNQKGLKKWLKVLGVDSANNFGDDSLLFFGW